jgi:citronellol/citronellal dehydrogenase
MMSKLCLEHLERSDNPHILMLSPPLDMKPKWFAPHLAYSIAKFGMSLCVLGLAEELRPQGIAVNALWPRTPIATAALSNIPHGEQIARMSRTPEILSDAAHVILTKPSREFTGNFCIDDTLLSEHGVTDFDRYRVDPSQNLAPDFFVPDDSVPPASMKAVSKPN